MLTPEQKAKIDAMGHEEMLLLNRFAPVGHPMFAGETGDYFLKVMSRKREEAGGAACVAASKRIGWEE